MHVLDTTSWFLSTVVIIFAGGWLNWDDILEHWWRAKGIVEKLGPKWGRIVYLFLMSVIGASLILRLFGGW